MVFQKDFFENVNFEKSQQTTTKSWKIPSMQIANIAFITSYCVYSLTNKL